MANLLLIDDDVSLTELLSDYLVNQGHELHIVHDGIVGIRHFFTLQPDLVVLDVTMPNRDGWGVLERIREMSQTPVIMLTARNEESHILRGFSLGADDYVTKPFSFAQLAARIQAVLARSTQENASDESELRSGDLVVDLSTKRVWRGSELLHLTPTEFKLLVTLMRHPGQVLTQEALVSEVWGEQYVEDVGYVRRYVWHLRKKIEADLDNPQYIHNERGFGYRFAAAPTP